MATAVKIRDLKGGKPCYKSICKGSTAFYEYKNLLLNNLKIERTDGQEMKADEEAFIKDELIETGQVGYDCITQKWAGAKGQGVNELGNPTHIVFVFRNGFTYQREAYYKPDTSGAYIIKAMESNFSLAEMIRQTTDFMDQSDVAILQNVMASKIPAVFVLSDENLQLSLKQAVQQVQNGEPVVIVSPQLGDAMKGVATNFNFVADKIDELKGKYRDRLLNKIGIMSANIDKKERVQVGEVNATTGQCVDYIYMVIDTFNKYCDYYKLPFKMKMNGSLEELYEEPQKESEGDENESQQDESSL